MVHPLSLQQWINAERGGILFHRLAAFRCTERRNWLYSAFLVRCFDTPSSAPVPNTIFRTGQCLMIRANAHLQGCVAFDKSPLSICQCAFDQLEHCLVEMRLTNDRSGCLSVRLTNSRLSTPRFRRLQIGFAAKVYPSIARSWPANTTDQSVRIAHSGLSSGSLSIRIRATVLRLRHRFSQPATSI
jgi:hypothetical protein